MAGSRATRVRRPAWSPGARALRPLAAAVLAGDEGGRRFGLQGGASAHSGTRPAVAARRRRRPRRRGHDRARSRRPGGRLGSGRDDGGQLTGAGGEDEQQGASRTPARGSRGRAGCLRGRPLWQVRPLARAWTDKHCAMITSPCSMPSRRSGDYTALRRAGEMDSWCEQDMMWHYEHRRLCLRPNRRRNSMGDLVTRQGLYFEDYNIGDTATTQGRTVTETDIVNFAALSGDWNADPRRRGVCQGRDVRRAHRARPAGPVDRERACHPARLSSKRR